MKNVHVRRMAGSIEQVRAWIDTTWSGTDDDCFPRDVIPSFRKNAPGVDPMALIPGETRVGHGRMSFVFQSWDGVTWRVGVRGTGMTGWHGFDLVADGDGTRLTHTLELELRGKARLVWPLLIAPMHDWAVEALFDRMEVALATGRAPRVTARRMPFPASALFSLSVARAARSARRDLVAATAR